MITVETTTAAEVTQATILEALYRLPPEYFPDVLQFIQFLEHKLTTTPDDASEDEALWDAVQANHAYREQHPEEELETYQSGEDFLEAVADL